jgi:hypothetical protein
LGSIVRREHIASTAAFLFSTPKRLKTICNSLLRPPLVFDLQRMINDTKPAQTTAQAAQRASHHLDLIPAGFSEIMFSLLV